MKFKYQILITSVLCIIIGSFLTVANAYVLEGFKWRSLPVGFYIQDTWASSYETNNINNAANEWNNAGTDFRFQYNGLTTISENSSTDGYNTITSDDLSNIGIIGLAITTVPDGSFATDTDTVFNTYYAFSDGGDSTHYDIQSVMAHEFGHWLGLDHTQSENCTVVSNSPIMCPTIGQGQTYDRTLKQDDIDGIRQIYPITVGGTISTNTRWAKGIYVIQGRLTVASGVTLTVDPGVIIKVNNSPYYADLEVNGSLIINGIASDKVYVTSFKDDSIGGDTNNDGSNTSPARRDYDFLSLHSNANAYINYAEIRYTGQNNSAIHNEGELEVTYSEFNNNLTAIQNSSGGNLDINNSKVLNSSTGIFDSNGSNLTITFNEFDNNGVGVLIPYGNVIADINNNIFKNSTNEAIIDRSDAGSSLTLSNNSFINNADAVQISPNVIFNAQGTSITGGSLNGYVIFGGLAVNNTWIKNDLPYVIDSVEILTGRVLTLNPGVIVKFKPAGIMVIDSSGDFQAIGSSSNKIYFTSIKDDLIGGDTNMDGATTLPAPGDWDDLFFYSDSIGKFDNTVFSYGSSNSSITSEGVISLWKTTPDPSQTQIDISNSKFYKNNNAIYIRDGSLNISSTRFDNNLVGLYSIGGTAIVNLSSFSGNTNYAILNTSVTSPVNAIGNWWNSILGPNNTANPLSPGDKVSDNVVYHPWLVTDPN